MYAPAGPTSAGKTSMVRELAKQTGHRCVRINNHEGTDLQVMALSLEALDGAVHI